MISEGWLKKVNEEFRNAGIDQRRRPWDAISRYSTEFNTSVDISSDVANKIFEWFEAHSKPGEGHSTLSDKRQLFQNICSYRHR